MNRKFNPSSIAPPGGRYTHAIEVPPGARWLVVSGQVGVSAVCKLFDVGVAERKEQGSGEPVGVVVEAGVAKCGGQPGAHC